MLGSSTEGPTPPEAGAGPSSGEDERMKFEDSERNSGSSGNRWPRQETLALLKIRSDMDSAFRDSSLKAPLWDEVSRKLAELGYHRNPKKCKEKFENVYKYHKRTKDCRSTKSEGKSYRFFEQLEALDQNQPSSQFHRLPSQQRSQNQGPESPTPVAMAMPTNIHHQIFPQVTVSSTPIITANVSHINTSTTLPSSNSNPPPITNASVLENNINVTQNVSSQKNVNTDLDGEFGSDFSSSSSDEEQDPERRTKRKRKWESFFQNLMGEVIRKQEQMQKNFLETLERRERDRLAREEAWRAQESARINREHEMFAQERSLAAAKDSAVIAYLQKVSDMNQQTNKTQTPTTQTKQNIPIPIPIPIPLQIPNPNPISSSIPLPPPLPPPQSAQPPSEHLQLQPYGHANRNGITHAAGSTPSSSRWPKEEIEALIQIRTNMDVKYEENGPKGPMWEEVSFEMKRIGYERSAKRCKEKWENINKYFKKVKESNKERPEDSKTCPYFNLLDQIYKQKAKPIMAQPEQQWPQPQQKNDEIEGEDENVTNEEKEDH